MSYLVTLEVVKMSYPFVGSGTTCIEVLMKMMLKKKKIMLSLPKQESVLQINLRSLHF